MTHDPDRYPECEGFMRPVGCGSVHPTMDVYHPDGHLVPEECCCGPLAALEARARADERERAAERVAAIEHWASYSSDGDVWACFASDPIAAARGSE